jgi:hemoglobin/transferrin/lactoferrin receptor protein
MYGRTGLTLKMSKLKGEVYALYNGWKRLRDYNMIGEDNFQYATSQGSPAWMTLNVRVGYQVIRNVAIQVACENLLDQNYRVFSSGLTAPGRNVVVTLRGSF